MEAILTALIMALSFFPVLTICVIKRTSERL